MIRLCTLVGAAATCFGTGLVSLLRPSSDFVNLVGFEVTRLEATLPGVNVRPRPVLDGGTVFVVPVFPMGAIGNLGFWTTGVVDLRALAGDLGEAVCSLVGIAVDLVEKDAGFVEFGARGVLDVRFASDVALDATGVGFVDFTELLVFNPGFPLVAVACFEGLGGRDVGGEVGACACPSAITGCDSIAAGTVGIDVSGFVAGSVDIRWLFFVKKGRMAGCGVAGSCTMNVWSRHVAPSPESIQISIHASILQIFKIEMPGVQ